MIQQNIGEDIDNHGLLLWDTHNHTCQFIPIKNNYVFINAIIDNGIITNTDVLEKYKDRHLRIHCRNTNTTASQYTKLQEELKKEFHVHEIKTKPIGYVASYTTKNNQGNDNVVIEKQLIEKLCKPELYTDIIQLHETFKSNEKISQQSNVWNIIESQVSKCLRLWQ